MLQLWCGINSYNHYKFNCDCNQQKLNSPKQKKLHVIILMKRVCSHCSSRRGQNKLLKKPKPQKLTSTNCQSCTTLTVPMPLQCFKSLEKVFHTCQNPSLVQTPLAPLPTAKPLLAFSPKHFWASGTPSTETQSFGQECLTRTGFTAPPKVFIKISWELFYVMARASLHKF